jgi:para-nitrobenzyl esterase
VSDNLVVSTTYGDIQGIRENGIVYFKGIPYAKPPIGELRFQAPQKPEPWNGIKDATKVSHAAPQNKGFVAMVESTGENCLYLNIATPAIDETKRPVMFWIHGGSFTTGGGEQSVYLNAPLPKDQDVVLVTINYRLGVLGFVNFAGVANDHIKFASNNGLRDMIAALEWVKDNISYFGGDPNNVTIFGESAGAMGVGCLLGSPMAKGLFHKAIAQSGAAHLTSLPEDADKVANAFLNEVGISADNIEAIKDLSVADILKAQDKIGNIKFSNEGRAYRLPVSSFVFIPTIGDDVLPKDPLDAIEEGLSKGIPLLVGSNLHEWNFFVQLSDPGKNNLDKEALIKVINTRVPKHAKEAVACYFDDKELAKPVDVFSAIESDRFFRIPTIRLLEAHQQHQTNCYSYLFTYEATLLDGKLGSCHAVEIPFVFGSIHDNFAKLLCGESPDMKVLSDKCVAAWASFARTGSPQNKTLEDWPVYECDERMTMELGLNCGKLRDPMREQREFWHELL